MSDAKTRLERFESGLDKCMENLDFLCLDCWPDKHYPLFIALYAIMACLRLITLTLMDKKKGGV